MDASWTCARGKRAGRGVRRAVAEVAEEAALPERVAAAAPRPSARCGGERVRRAGGDGGRRLRAERLDKAERVERPLGGEQRGQARAAPLGAHLARVPERRRGGGAEAAKRRHVADRREVGHDVGDERLGKLEQRQHLARLDVQERRGGEGGAQPRRLPAEQARSLGRRRRAAGDGGVGERAERSERSRPRVGAGVRGGSGEHVCCRAHHFLWRKGGEFSFA